MDKLIKFNALCCSITDNDLQLDKYLIYSLLGFNDFLKKAPVLYCIIL